MYQYFIAPIIGYLLGSIPFAWIIVKLVTGKDVREEGSRSVSTRNTVRTAGYFWAILTAALDITKGFLAAFLVRFYLTQLPVALTPDLSIFCTALAGIGAFAGHLWMPWLGFKGGKGFAVFSGVLIVLNPYGILVWWLSLPIFLIIIRYGYLGGLSATITASLLGMFFFIFGHAKGIPNPYWSDWGVMVHGFGSVIVLLLRLIPDFKAMKAGEIKRWSGIKVSQWMR
ncbi:MAG: glycerol-3-phosphate acyltransferase [Candidatus Heimdallarchaeota archaeon]|nr:glycerol-3-phosphate acyltransferase [Candidatus Heimdallarchaeota archaeon]